jgi:hypothetical protein
VHVPNTMFSRTARLLDRGRLFFPGPLCQPSVQVWATHSYPDRDRLNLRTLRIRLKVQLEVHGDYNIDINLHIENSAPTATVRSVALPERGPAAHSAPSPPGAGL